jgi:hypothetical protein
VGVSARGKETGLSCSPKRSPHLIEDHSLDRHVDDGLLLPRELHAVALALRPVGNRRAPRAFLGPVVGTETRGIDAVRCGCRRVGRPRAEIRAADGVAEDRERRRALAALVEEVGEAHGEEEGRRRHAVELAEAHVARAQHLRAVV